MYKELFNIGKEKNSFYGRKKIINLIPPPLLFLLSPSLALIPFLLYLWRRTLAMDSRDGPGTVEFAPPEAFRSSFSYKSDVWACGVTLFWLLSGRYPFDSPDGICSRRPVAFLDTSWANVSREAKDLVCVHDHE